MEGGISLNESVSQALHVMRFTIDTGPKITPLELHHGRKPRIQLTNIVKNGKTYSYNWTEMAVSATNRPKIPIYVGGDAEGEVTNHLIMAKTKTEENYLIKGPKSPKKKSWVKYHFQFVEKNNNKKSLDRKLQKS